MRRAYFASATSNKYFHEPFGPLPGAPRPSKVSMLGQILENRQYNGMLPKYTTTKKTNLASKGQGIGSLSNQELLSLCVP
jgi:hypothetical protein